MKTASQLLRLKRRQVFRLLKAYRIEGPTGLISKRRSRPSNRRKPEALRRAVLTIIRHWYWDFGPTLAAETLSGLGKAPTPTEPLKPTVPIRRSVHPEYVVCLECGFRGRTLRRHLRVAHDFNPAAYYARWTRGVRSSVPRVRARSHRGAARVE